MQVDDSAKRETEAKVADLRATLDRELATQKLLDHQLRQARPLMMMISAPSPVRPDPHP